MLQGQITAKVTDIHIDLNSSPFRVTATVCRYQEDSDGQLNTLESKSVDIFTADLTPYIKAALKQDVIAAVKAANAKMPASIS